MKLLDEFPELHGQFPDLDYDELFVGTWDERKSPQSLAHRRFLAASLRVFRSARESSPESRKQLRELHLKWRTAFIATEVQVAAFRQSFFSGYLKYLKPEGGVQ